jgi:hypothetical protein
MARRGNPPLPVRASDAAKEPWKAAAARAGLTLTAWVHQTLNTAAGLTPGGKARVPTSDQGAAFADAVAPDPVGQMPDCPHPRGERVPLGYGTKCGLCGKVNP